MIPECLFNKENRKNLIKLPAHKRCNASFSKDDEYFRLCLTAISYDQPQAKELWSGPVMRGIHRPASERFKASVLKSLIPIDVQSEAGLYLGTAEAMLQDASEHPS